ncbi:MAG TPA: NAD(P)/FAD-dependent oxidoreductase [Reyranella sp.]|nr:NAD(P)/FAD-dependent oxidoreductase [Reyranella sp.]
MTTARSLVIVGGGPSGMAAALEALKGGARPTVLERLDKVGGLARTIEYQGCRFDIGPHRFFTMNPEIQKLFVEVCGADLCKVPRLTRIFYKRRYFNYPLTPLNALFGMGILTSIRIFLSYVAARLRRVLGRPQLLSFEDWVVDRFGRRLYETFFKTYTEKVWGISCRNIGADWAGQRIKGLSLIAAIANALFRSRTKTIKTLVDEFLYPRLGAGQLYEKMAALVTEGGGTVRTKAEVLRLNRSGFQVMSVDCRTDGQPQSIGGDFFLSSAPLTDLVQQLEPPAPAEVLEAARSLRYRNHIGVNLIIEGDPPFPDNWIYVHSPDVRMARICDYLNFSPEMSPSRGVRALTVEYFCFAGDDLWESTDQQLIERAQVELKTMGIAHGRVVGAFAVRSEKAYPVIEIGYEAKIKVIKEFLDRFENLLPIGRSGMFKYNNQDHAMATGLYAARTALGQGKFDPWLVNIDGVYHEAGTVTA